MTPRPITEIEAEIQALRAAPPPDPDGYVDPPFIEPERRWGDSPEYAVHRVREAKDLYEKTRRIRASNYAERMRRQHRNHEAAIRDLEKEHAAAREAEAWLEAHGEIVEGLVDDGAPELAARARELAARKAGDIADVERYEIALASYRELLNDLGPEPTEPTDPDERAALARDGELGALVERRAGWLDRRVQIEDSIKALEDGIAERGRKIAGTDLELRDLRTRAAKGIGAALALQIAELATRQRHLGVLVRSAWSMAPPGPHLNVELRGVGRVIVQGDTLVLQIGLPAARPDIGPIVEQLLAGNPPAPFVTTSLCNAVLGMNEGAGR